MSTGPVTFTPGESEFTVLPNGTYEAVIVDIEEREGEKAPYLLIRMMVTTGEFEGQNVFDNLSLSPKAGWKQAQFLGATLDREFAAGEPVNIDPAELLGHDVRINVEQRSYQGQMRNAVRTYLPPASEAVKDLWQEDGKTEADEVEDEDEEETEEIEISLSELANMSKTELNAVAKQLGMSGYTKLKREDLLLAVLAAAAEE